MTRWYTGSRFPMKSWCMLSFVTAGAAFTVLAFLHVFRPGVFNKMYSTEDKLNIESHENSFSSAINSATGAVFTGARNRNYNGPTSFDDLDTSRTQSSTSILFHPSFNEMITCTKWSVLTTISAATTAVTTAAELEGWCLVIVADKKTPNNYLDTPKLRDRKNVFFLGVELQEKYSHMSGKIGALFQLIPYNHFARKNIGYLFAIQHGARFIFDFDDDNELKRSADGKILAPLGTNETHLEDADEVLVTTTAFNPYPLMGATVENSWPRGFPLESVMQGATRGAIIYPITAISYDQIGVLQFTADHNPDIDAIHRLTRPLPMNFNYNGGSGGLLSPLHVFTPYNAQATVHTIHALWATLLPTTVPGRVSDIWRGYFAECLFRDANLRVAFLPPHVVQDRNEHNIIGDMKAEEDLYYKTKQLLDFLNHWNNPARTIPARMEQLWIALYERGYIELGDVQLLQLWLGILVECGYSFPVLFPGRYHNVVVMGQFNYAESVEKYNFGSRNGEVSFNMWRFVVHFLMMSSPTLVCMTSRHMQDEKIMDGFLRWRIWLAYCATITM